MKIGGKTIEAKNIEYIVIPRRDGDIVFVAQAVYDYESFEQHCKRPTPPMRTHPGGSVTYATDDKTYLELIGKWSSYHTDWLVLQSLAATEGLEWDTVDITKPDTYANWQTELKASGFTRSEINRVLSGVMTANGLNQARIDEAQKSFFDGLEAKRDSRLSLLSDPSSTPSGVPANG